MYHFKKIFLFSFLYCFSNVFQAEENEQIDDIKDYDLNKLKELFDSEEMKQFLEKDSLLKLLGKEPLSKNYFYSTNIGLGLHNNFSDIGHKLQNWCDSYLRFSETKKEINNALNNILEGKDIQEGCKYNKGYSGFYEYLNFMQSTLSNSFYINPSWNFQIKKSNFFTHIGLFIEKNASEYTYDFVIAEKKKEEEGKEENKEEEKKDEFIRKNVSTKRSFNTIKTGISFGFTWYRNKIYPWADWNISCMFSFGLQFLYNRNFDFGFYKWGIISWETEYDFHNQNNPNTMVWRTKQPNRYRYLGPLYGLLQISAGFNKFSIWFRIYYSPIVRNNFLKSEILPIYPNEHLNKEYYENNPDFKIEYKEKQVKLGTEFFLLDFNKISFAFGFSYSF